MKVHFWGVRGSIPVPGKKTVRYGGNTSCISVVLDDKSTLVLDAGTGIRLLGSVADGGPHTYYILLTHPHWDHIQGLPFFNPKMNPDVKIRILCEMQEDWGRQILRQLDGVCFPVKAEELTADVRLCASSVNDVFAKYQVSISWVRVNHPGICFGYRLDSPDGSLVYMTDNELVGSETTDSTRDALVSFSRQADVLIHDAQYTREDMPEKRGWGHSCVEEACDLAAESGVRRLILFHHDPDRTDSQIDEILESARSYLAGKDPTIACDAAYEGMELDI
ncbi:MAG: MBL fold metallo-hydrolase [Bacteroidetes bacterium]|nr:MBL fold metallo-hydrolase [Bacteroidota bacterium]